MRTFCLVLLLAFTGGVLSESRAQGGARGLQFLPRQLARRLVLGLALQLRRIDGRF